MNLRCFGAFLPFKTSFCFYWQVFDLSLLTSVEQNGNIFLLTQSSFFRFVVHLPIDQVDQVDHQQLLPQKKTRFSLFAKSWGVTLTQGGGSGDCINLDFSSDDWRLLIEIRAKCELYL